MASGGHGGTRPVKPGRSVETGLSPSDPEAAKQRSGPDAEPGGSGLVVGIGASAGGLGAFRAFFEAMPSDSGMAFVLVQHLAPDHKSMLADLLGRSTAMRVIEAVDGQPVAANMIYVIPPDATLTLKGRRLGVVRPAPPRERRRPIDTFFASLAEDQGENAICIVLSGTGSDGTLGLRAVKESGGLALAQAEFDHHAMSGMPHSAVTTGLVDDVMLAEHMPARLIEYQRHLQTVAARKDDGGTRQDMAGHLAAICKLLQGRIGHDFSKYKEKTLIRRIQRRMQVLQIGDVPAYIACLRDDPTQIDLLFRELLIGVTQFFRDPDAFAALRTIALPKLLENKGADDQLRIWTPACATGEETYSIAILVREALAGRRDAPRVQIFGTDIDDIAVAFARSARYRKVSGLSPERIERWFVEDGDEYSPVKDIREMCVFSTHSVVKDAPFSKLDLISCRNLLIYMEADLQDRVLQTFHYALKPDGVLFLGPSEGGARLSPIFTATDKKHRIHQRRDAEVTLPKLPLPDTTPKPAAATASIPGGDRIVRAAQRILEKYSPAFVVVDNDYQILRFSGSEMGRYLEPAAGPASLNLLGMLRKPLRSVVRAAMQGARADGDAVVQDDVTVRIEGNTRLITVIVEPIAAAGAGAGLYVVAFSDAGTAPHGKAAKSRIDTEAGTEALRHEVHTLKAQLQSTIDELETSNEEMKSASEEYQSVNEELQSSNEELETAKEEMQSVNEELQTINTEVAGKNELLTRLNSDLKNLLDSTEIATIFLDNDLRIKSFTPGMTEIFHLRDADRGRPVTEIVTLLDYADLRSDVRAVMRKLSVVEKELRLADGSMTFIMRIRPYRTIDNVIDGVVITFLDISERKLADDHTALLMSELDHRVKNILAIVTSVILQTLKTSPTPEVFAANMEGRIAAIARAHSLLTQKGKRDEASLRDIIATELDPYDRRKGNLALTGPDVALTPKAALAFAMAIHELASNAAKYGALSTAEGRLAVTCRTVDGAGTDTLHLVWIESGGPVVQPSRQRGFGTTLIERTLAHEFDATVNREFLPSGLRCTIEIPLTAEVGHVDKGDAR